MDMELLPNSGDTFFIPEVPEDQKAELAEERSTAQVSYPIQATLMAWFDDQIALAETVHGLNAESSVSIETQVLVKQNLAQAFISKRSELVTMFDEFSK